MKSLILEDVNALIVLCEEDSELQFNDLNSYWSDLKKSGFDDEKKLKGMFNKAKEIAKQQGKENDKKIVIGIIQSFLEK